MVPFKWVINFVMASGLLILIGCNKPTSPAQEKPKETVDAAGASIYPHTKEFIGTSIHGKTYLENASACAKCHGEDLKGGTAGVSCLKCHVHYPHPKDWGVPKNHGGAFLDAQQPDRDTCLKCHSSPEQEKYACAKCHSNFPHEGDFMATHPQKYKSDQAECKTCHQSLVRDFPTKQDGITCKKCHLDKFPHPSNWAGPTGHGAFFKELSLDDRKRCLACHQDQKQVSGVTCSQCHKAYPHPDDVLDSHPKFAKGGQASCSLCHKDGKTNTPSLPDTGCITCHEGVLGERWQVKLKLPKTKSLLKKDAPVRGVTSERKKKK